MNPKSLALVCLQFLLIALIVSPVRTLWPDSVSGLAGAILLLGGLGLGIWALVTMRSGTFSVLPEPVTDGVLITRGPYRFVRHPMYAAVLLACLGATVLHASLLKLVWFLALVAVLAMKIRREESLLAERYADYRQYRQSTKALVPGLY